MTKISIAISATALFLFAATLYIWFSHEDFQKVYQADYVGSEVCGGCHVINHAKWKESPHHKITQTPSPTSVVGDFDNGVWHLPEKDRVGPNDHLPAVKTSKQGDRYFMSLRLPNSEQYRQFSVDRVVGYQYRQTYLTLESQGVYRRLPVQWSVSRGDFFSYWNEQEGSAHTIADLWAQMGSLNSAWNLYCGRCHTTNLDIKAKDKYHRIAQTEWTEPGVGCESCHGPGSKHLDYMVNKPSNRLMSFVNQVLNKQKAPYIMNAAHLEKGVALSVCARCHGSDILRKRMNIYRSYEPGFDAHGRYNDLSQYFTEGKLEPGSTAPTIEVWIDGRPKGLGMLFRTFADSSHYEKTDMRCFSCHDAHQNKLEVSKGLKQASAESNAFCGGCHEDIVKEGEKHSHHVANTPGSFCYDCHMPKNISNAVAGDIHFVRTHNMGSIPNPYLSARYGVERSPNACNECHEDKSPQWAVETLNAWGQTSHLKDVPLHLNRTANSDTVH